MDVQKNCNIIELISSKAKHNKIKMKKIILLSVFLFAMAGYSQELYIKTFGRASATPILFLHGGPGYNSAGFEITTAQKLADSGFFVIIYDRRGEGRSEDTNAKYNLEQTFDDINVIYKKYNLKKANLMGHSFGGIVATLFTEKNREKVASVILVSAPLSLQESFKTIQSSSRNIYIEKGDKTNLNYLDMIEKMDSASMEYASYSFMHAMQNGFYSPKRPSAEAKVIYENAAKDSNFSYLRQMTSEPPKGFLKNESYTTLDLGKNIEALVSKKVKVYGLYGKEDGLYSIEQISKLQKIIGSPNLKYFDDCSHNVFIDKQDLFLRSIKAYLK